MSRGAVCGWSGRCGASGVVVAAECVWSVRDGLTGGPLLLGDVAGLCPDGEEPGPSGECVVGAFVVCAGGEESGPRGA